jgi:hypothetical protein
MNAADETTSLSDKPNFALPIVVIASLIAAACFMFFVSVPGPTPVTTPPNPAAEAQLYEKIEAAMRSHDVILGMHEANVLSSWGEPENKKLTPTKTGIHAQWIYSDGRTVFFESGKVTAINTKK